MKSLLTFISIFVLTFSITIGSIFSRPQVIPNICVVPNSFSVIPTSKVSLEIDDLLENLNAISVLVQHDYGIGSGTLINKSIKIDGIEKNYQFVLTCGHVVERMKKDGGFDSSKITVNQYQEIDGKIFLGKSSKVKVIGFSAEATKDIAILLVSDNFNVNKNQDFYLEKHNNKVGTKLIHVGSSFGFNNSFFFGRLSKVGRIIPIEGINQIFDQAQLGGNKGSSGGGVFTEDGKYIGMFARFMSENVNFIIPIRVIYEWASNNNFGWLLNPDVKIPVNIKEILEGSLVK